ncbi:MAG: hypothetical protein QXM31_02955 [Candidatus Woesearchaeota archaeon]
MRKKGIELQFNWIFIMIAGAVILAFFFGIVQNQRSLSEKKLSLTLASHMDAVFTGAIESRGTGQDLVIPAPGIAFSCSSTCDCLYKIGKEPTSLDGKILFAPALIKDQDARALALEWKVPFRAANFLFITNPLVKYYFVYDSENARSVLLYRKVAKALQRDINSEPVSSPYSIAGIRPGGYLHTRFVFLGTKLPDLGLLDSSFADEDVSGVWIDEDEQKVVFYEKSGRGGLEFNSRPSLLAGNTALFGSIYAADSQMYDCMMRSAFDKLAAVAQVHAKRAGMLKEAMLAEQRLDCSGAYSQIIEDLASVSQKAAFLASSFPEAGSLAGAEALKNFLGTQSVLQQQNQNLILQSCPELY